MNKLFTISLFCFAAGTSAQLQADGRFRYDSGLAQLLNLSAEYLLINDQANHYQSHQRDRRHDRQKDHRGASRFNANDHRRGFRAQPGRPAIGSYSFTSQAIRGGSSRRTRVIDNPYPGRRVTGITLTGIDNDIVHVKDVIAYPGRYALSHRAYTLSAYHPERYVNARGYIDYISVQAKRKEYFTLTFHYE
jgi:hypothetical protein